MNHEYSVTTGDEAQCESEENLIYVCYVPTIFLRGECLDCTYYNRCKMDRKWDEYPTHPSFTKGRPNPKGRVRGTKGNTKTKEKGEM